jgi:hypothetical protein
MTSLTSLLLIASVIFAGCSSSPKHDQSMKVIGRIDGLSERPSWVTESEPFKIVDGKVQVIGKHTIQSSQSTEQAFRAADLNAKSQVVQAIEQRIQTAFQNSEEGFDGASQARFTGMIATDVVTTSSIRSSKRYWERYLPISSIDNRDEKIDAFVLIEMPEADFKRSVLNAMRKQEGKGSISSDFSKKVDQQWNTIMRTPSSESTQESN